MQIKTRGRGVKTETAPFSVHDGHEGHLYAGVFGSRRADQGRRISGTRDAAAACDQGGFGVTQHIGAKLVDRPRIARREGLRRQSSVTTARYFLGGPSSLGV